MVILGLGTNVGDRLEELRQGLAALKKIPSLTVKRVSPVYWSEALLTEDAIAEWNLPYLNAAVACETTLTPQELLQHCKRIEVEQGRVAGAKWQPRPLDIDILAWDDLVIYDDTLHIPHEHLSARPFALWPLADVAPHWQHPLLAGQTATELCAAWGSRFTGNAPLQTRQIMQRIDTPALVGIINVTPNSFSDGGQALNMGAALQQAHDLVNAGAEILDLGAEASHPHAQALTAEIEWQRLEPILAAILYEKSHLIIPPKISVDTRHPEIAAKALTLGVDWINDVSGLTNPAMREIIAASECDVVMMHQLGIPANHANVLPLHQDAGKIIYTWAEQQLEQLTQWGIAKTRVIFDVGIGFGKTATQSLTLLQNIPLFQQLQQRLLVGHSRKSFLSLFTDKEPVARDIETLPISLHLAQLDIHYLRLHNVEYCARAFKVARILI